MKPARSRRQTLLILFAGGIAVCATLFFTITFSQMNTENIGNTLTGNAADLASTTGDLLLPEDNPPTTRLQKKTTAPQSGATVKLGSVVTYTSDGFSPSRVTINKGESVHFINQSDRKLWVASDVHPTHAAYPERDLSNCLGSSFDQCKAVGTGESWDFTFDAPGEWDYHNHMRARDVGTVVVAE